MKKTVVLLLALLIPCTVLLSSCELLGLKPIVPPDELINQSPETMFDSFLNPVYRITSNSNYSYSSDEVEIVTDDTKPERVCARFTTFDGHGDPITIVYDTLVRNEVYLLRDVSKDGLVVERHYALVEKIEDFYGRPLSTIFNARVGSTNKTRLDTIGPIIQEKIRSAYAYQKSYFTYKDEPYNGWKPSAPDAKTSFVLSSDERSSFYADYANESLQNIQSWGFWDHSVRVYETSFPNGPKNVSLASDVITKTVDELLNNAISLDRLTNANNTLLEYVA